MKPSTPLNLEYFVMDPSHSMFGGSPSKTFSGTWRWNNPHHVLSVGTVGVGAKVATGRTVGVLSGDFSLGNFMSFGTFVSRNHRRSGVALRLWRLLVEHYDPTKVISSAVSDKGWTLLNLLVLSYPRIKWVIYDAGERPLRLLGGQVRQCEK